MNNKGKIVMLLFIGSEAFFFIALIIAYVYYRNFTDATDTVAKYLDALRTGIFTLFLIASSVSLIFSKKAFLKGNLLRYKILMTITILLGIIFIIGQINEYVGLYDKQVTLKQDIFGSSFFALTGFHGLHVIIGIIVLSILLGISLGKMRIVTLSAIHGADMYWHFVDVVWLFVFYFVYITPLL